MKHISITNENRYNRVDACNFLVVPRHEYVKPTEYLDVRKLTICNMGLDPDDDSDISEILKKVVSEQND